ncbi:MAG: class II glutamine amidotransferase [Eubacterium sp.]|nr:class II glutamine amidotransferase [Eubacterium sp.]
MCELFGISANRKVKLNKLLKHFFEHSSEHPNGWGMAFLDDYNISIEKEPVRARDSLYLKNRLTGRLESGRMMAHIRRATVGDICFDNTHPFTARDESGRTWVLVHNGTIFNAPVLSPYQYKQHGDTDSERILLYIIDHVNRVFLRELNSFDVNERVRLLEQIIRTLAQGNKLNILLYDGDYFYVHKNEAGTLFKSERPGSVMFSTHPLSDEGWEELPQNQLLVYKDGELIHTGTQHEFTYVQNEEDMKMLYLGYAGL